MGIIFLHRLLHSILHWYFGRWQTQRGVVTIPKSITQSRIKENIQVSACFLILPSFSFTVTMQWIYSAHLQVFDFTLEPEEISQVTALHRGWRYIVPTITVSYITVSHNIALNFTVVTSEVNLMLNLLRLSQITCSPTLCMVLRLFECCCVFLFFVGRWKVCTPGCRTSSLPI